MRKKIAVLGAYDRCNYGDLLFPLIIEHLLRSNKYDCDLEYYGLIDSDLSLYGGKPTKSIKRLFEKENLRDGDILIVAGGDVLSTTWSVMYSCFLTDPFRKIMLKVVRKLFGHNFIDNISRKLLNSELVLPWVISPDDFHAKVKVIYNTVGGSGIDQLPSAYQNVMMDKLSRAAHLSVRDLKTHELLKMLKVNSRLAPDSAISISDIFPLNQLEKMVNAKTKRIIEQFAGGYICLQINLRWSKGNESIIASELEKIYNNLGYGTVLLPIGRAYEHEDHIALDGIKKILRSPSIIPDRNSVYDIMMLIAMSKVFIGTSLHGNITAMSYAVPHIGLTENIPKLTSFLKTWDIEEQSICSPCKELWINVKRVIDLPKDKLVNKKNETATLYYNNFVDLKNCFD